MGKPEKTGYFGQILRGLGSVWKGMRVTGRHFQEGLTYREPLGIDHPDYFRFADQGVTVEYPQVQVPIPDRGRYRLHLETDDCIACDKCARICPVDCIEIKSFRAAGDLGRTRDGTLKRLHLPVFNIDLGKCMFCGLCTTVCPTECLTMTPVHDYSYFQKNQLIHHFGTMGPEEEDRVRKETELALAQQKATKEGQTNEQLGSGAISKRPIVVRKVALPPEEGSPEQEESSSSSQEPKTTYFPKRPIQNKPPDPPKEETNVKNPVPDGKEEGEEKPKFIPKKRIIKPVLPPPTQEGPTVEEKNPGAQEKPKFVPRRPIIKPQPPREDAP